MQVFDQKYIETQLRLKILESKSTAFQAFFEKVMLEKFDDFINVDPWGSKGDGGNDGFTRKSGQYYQVYSPRTPQLKSASAVKKLNKDFNRLKETWGQFSEIKKYFFVFNDEFRGTIEDIEKALAILKKSNPNIDFFTFTSNDLARVFWTLNETSIQRLGFDISQRRLVDVFYKALRAIETELDRERLETAENLFKYIESETSAVDDDNLNFNLKIVKSLLLRKQEKTIEAEKILLELKSTYPCEVKPYLYLAEIKTQHRLFTDAEKLLVEAERISPQNPLVDIFTLVYRLNSSEKVDTKSITIHKFDCYQKEIRSNLYRLYSLVFAEARDFRKAREYINKAIRVYPERVANKLTQITVTQAQLSSQQVEVLDDFKDEIMQLESDLDIKIPDRTRLVLLHKKTYLFRIEQQIQELEKISSELFEYILRCDYDSQIDNILADLLSYLRMPDSDLQRLCSYLSKSKMLPSEALTKRIFTQIADRTTTSSNLLHEFEVYFADKNSIFAAMIHAFTNNQYEKLEDFLEKDIAITLSTLSITAPIQEQIIEKYDFKDKVLKIRLHLNYLLREKRFKEALTVLGAIDSSILSDSELHSILNGANALKAWNVAIKTIKLLLERSIDVKTRNHLEYDLLQLYTIQGDHLKTIEIAKKLLDKYPILEQFLERKEISYIIVRLILSCIYRSRLDPLLLNTAQIYLEKFPEDYISEFSWEVAAVTKLYIELGRHDRALETVSNAAKRKSKLTQADYLGMYFPLCIEIANGLKWSPTEQKVVAEGNFVKLSNNNDWIYLGKNTPLNATITLKGAELYNNLIGKKQNTTIQFKNIGKKEKIEHIFNFNDYLIWDTNNVISKLVPAGAIPGVFAINMIKDGQIDLSELKQFIVKLNQSTQTFFNEYAQGALPFSMLIFSEGSISNALNRILREQRGYIHALSGSQTELEAQLNTARDIIDENLNYYIDGTSALFLIESSILGKIVSFAPNIIVPQSVINYLMTLLDKLNSESGTVTFLGESKGELQIRKYDKETLANHRDRIRDGIRMLETKAKRVENISPNERHKSFSENKIPKAFSDACILAQKNEFPVLTEDYLQLQVNSIETKKKIPRYFSSFSMARLLYSRGLIDSDTFYNYFSYLATYRVRFLSISSNDLEESILGNSTIKQLNIEGIERLNLGLTLSEEYGVNLKNALQVIVSFLLKFLQDDSINTEDSTKVFNKVINNLQIKMDVSRLGYILLHLCEVAREKQVGLIIHSQLFDTKIDQLKTSFSLFNGSNSLLLPTNVGRKTQ